VATAATSLRDGRAQGPVIAVASDRHAAKIDFDDLQLERKYSWVRAELC
jgi:hypothetical protein